MKVEFRQFYIVGIMTQLRKKTFMPVQYDHLVIAKLGKELITQVTDILVTPPKTGKYDALKTRLLAI